MSNYTKTTNFASKDALARGNPSKIIKGTELDNEFNAIQSAVATKADSSSPSFSGTPTAPTPSFGDDSTKIATTAFVQDALASAYPIGSVYINASVATNPATLLGFGTWTAFGAGRVLVGFDSGNSLFDTAGETGGSYDAVAVSHTHTITDAGHSHVGGYGATSPAPRYGATSTGTSARIDCSASSSDESITGTNTSTNTTGITINSGGESGTNKNIQPYITVYMWTRTA